MNRERLRELWPGHITPEPNKKACSMTYNWNLVSNENVAESAAQYLRDAIEANFQDSGITVAWSCRDEFTGEVQFPRVKVEMTPNLARALASLLTEVRA